MSAIVDAWPVLAGLGLVLLVVGRSQHQLSDVVRRVAQLETTTTQASVALARVEERLRDR